MLKTVEEFIEFYESMPDSRWCTFRFTEFKLVSGKFVPTGRHCAEGLIEYGEGNVERLDELFALIDAIPNRVNDGIDYRFQQPTPKSRILAALTMIRNTEIAVFTANKILDRQKLKTV